MARLFKRIFEFGRRIEPMIAIKRVADWFRALLLSQPGSRSDSSILCRSAAFKLVDFRQLPLKAVNATGKASNRPSVDPVANVLRYAMRSVRHSEGRASPKCLRPHAHPREPTSLRISRNCFRSCRYRCPYGLRLSKIIDFSARNAFATHGIPHTRAASGSI